MDTLTALIYSVVAGHPYLALFIGMLVAGDVVFIPAVYFSVHGTLSVWSILLIALVAGLLSDLVWYILGRMLPTERIREWRFIKKRQNLTDKLAALLEGHAFPIIVASKFIYGTRTLVQIVAGAKKMHWWSYLAATVLGHLLWFSAATALAHIIGRSLGTLRETLVGASVTFAVFVVIIIIAEIILSRFLKRKYHLQNGTETK